MLKEYNTILRRGMILADMLFISAVYALAIFYAHYLPQPHADFGIWHLAVVLCLWVGLLSYSGMYRSFRTQDVAESVYLIFRSGFIGLLMVSAGMFFFKIQSLDRLFVAMVFLAVTLVLTLERVAMMLLLRSLRRRGYNYRNILIVGTNKRAQHFVDILNQHAEWGFRIIGLLDSDPHKKGQLVAGVRVIGSFADFADVAHNNVVDEVVFVVPRAWLDKIEEMIYLCETEGIRFNVAVDFFDLKLAKAKQTELSGFPLLTFDTVSGKIWQLLAKRIMDFGFSAASLLILSPLFAVLALVIKLTSRGPVFFRQERSGLNGRRFMVYKFRTMFDGADGQKNGLLAQNEMSGPVFKIKNDPRITPIGGFLRRFSLDELPQLWNVFSGSMSLVGPRPPLPSEVNQYDNWHRRRLSMRPGITCLWQVMGRNNITDFNEWMRLDLKYIDNWSLWLDIKILLKTVPVVALGIGAK